MGLDNGLILKVKGEFNIDAMKENDEMPRFLELEKMDYISMPAGWSCYEICYWRKWWGFRNEVVNAIGMEDSDGEKELKTSDVVKMRDILIHYLTGEYDRDDISNIWDFDEVIEHIGWDIVKLSWLIDFMKGNAGDIIVEFYDSY